MIIFLFEFHINRNSTPPFNEVYILFHDKDKFKNAMKDE